MATLVAGKDVGKHEVWDPFGADNDGNPNGQLPAVLKYVPGQPKGYAEGETAAFRVELEATEGDTLIFIITLDLYGNGAYAFLGLEDWDTTFTQDGTHLDMPPDAGDLTGAVDGVNMTNATIGDTDTLGDPDGVTYLGTNFSGGVWTQSWAVEFTVADDGDATLDEDVTVYMVYGGHIAAPGDTITDYEPDYVPVVNADGVGGNDTDVPDGFGASNVGGTFQARVGGSGGDKTVNFKGDLIAPAEVDLSVIKSDDQSDTPTVTAGDDSPTADDDVNAFLNGSTFTYTIIAKNLSTDDAENVFVIDTLDAGVSYTGDGSEIVFTDTVGDPTTFVSHVNGVLTFDLGTLEAGEEVTIQFDVTIDSDFADVEELKVLQNSVEITTTTTETDTSNNTNTEPTPVKGPDAAGDITVTKTVTDVDGEGASASVDEAGDEVTYLITVTPTAGTNVPLTQVSVTDDVEGFGATDATAVLSGAFNVGDTNTDDLLDVGETWQYTASYIVTQADIDANGYNSEDGEINNLAFAQFTDEFNNLYDDDDDAEVPIVYNPAFTVTKVADVDSVDAKDDVITYTVTITNTGNVTLTGASVSDPLLTDLARTNSSINADADLDVGEVWTYTGTYTVLQSDIDDQGTGEPDDDDTDNDTDTPANPDVDIDNVVTVDFTETDEMTASDDVEIVYNPAFTVTKVADVDSVDAKDDVITYTVTITNTGNVTLTGASVSDPLLTDLARTNSSINADADLDVGEVWTYTGTYTVLQSDIDDQGTGEPDDDDTDNDTDTPANPDVDIDNVVTVDFTETDEMTASDDVEIVYNPAFTVTKVADVDSVDAKDDVITYTVTITNTGNVTLTGASVSDPLLTDLARTNSSINADADLDVGEVWTYTGTYTVLQSDIDDQGTGEPDDDDTDNDTDTPANPDVDIDNVVTVDFTETDEMTASDDVEIVYNPAFTVTKVADVDSVDAKDDVITYTVTITNTGNVTLTGASVSDPLLTDLARTNSSINADADLDVGEVWTYTGTYTVLQSDIDDQGTGEPDDDDTDNDTDTPANPDVDIDNVVTVDFTETDEMTASDDVEIVYDPEITLVKKTNDTMDANLLIQAGDPVEWTYFVENTGNVTLYDVTVEDDGGSPGDTGDDFFATPKETGGFNDGDANMNGALDLGEVWEFEASGTAVQGAYLNTAEATADTVDGAGGEEVTATDSESYLGTQPPVTIVGNPRFNFPNDVNKIQPKVNPSNSFTLNPQGTIYWDIFTRDDLNASILLTSDLSGYAFDTEIVEIYNDGSGTGAVYRIFVTNQTDDPITLANNTDIVTYLNDLTGASDKEKLDLVNADPIIGNFNNFNNIENAIPKAINNFDTGVGGVTPTGNSDRIWKSTDVTGVANDEAVGPELSGGNGDDLIYGVNQMEGVEETINGGDGNDMIDGRDGDDILNGDAGDDYLYGGLGSDVLNGGADNDVLVGSYGIDTMTGGAGDDRFVLDPGAFDLITDFEADGDDTILFGDFGLNNTGGGGAAARNPTAAEFLSASDLSTAAGTEIFFYETDTGFLFFDPTGVGANGTDTGDMVLIASLTNMPAALTTSDILFDADLL